MTGVGETAREGKGVWERGEDGREEDERQVQGSLPAYVCIQVYAIENEARLNELLSLSSDEHLEAPISVFGNICPEEHISLPDLPHMHHSMLVYTCTTQLKHTEH